MENNASPLLEMREIVKDFPGVRALDHVRLTVGRGEIHGLVGANGAGKSTLIKVLGGVYADYGGTILLEDEPCRITSPQEASALGVAVIHQEFSLVPKLTVAENIMLGREPLRRKAGMSFIAWRELYEKAERVLADLGFRVSADAKVGDLGVAEQQLVQIAKAMAGQAQVLVMDEPTARLSKSERDELFTIMRRLKQGGTGIIYISHFLEEVFMIAERITVLRDGRVVHTGMASGLTRDDLVRMMLGRDLAVTEKKRLAPTGSEVLKVEGLTRPGKFQGVSFTLHRGEILGIAGLVGSGRTEVARAIFGADRPAPTGQLRVEGAGYVPLSPKRAITQGIALVPEDRKQQGLALIRPVADNVAITVTGQLRRGPFMNLRARTGLVQSMVERLKIKCSSPRVQAGTLSGGNQQKVVLAKWLAAKPRLLILDQPTAGIDVGSKEEIYVFLEQLAEAGAALMVISDDPEELARVCDRVLIMRKGRIVRELGQHPTSEEVLSGVTADY